MAAKSLKELGMEFFDLCETGKGWDACKKYCAGDATFRSQADPLKDCKTVEAYTGGFMVGICTVMPGCKYDLLSASWDDERKALTVASIFHGTHSAAAPGFPPPTNKTTKSDYVYVLFFNEEGKIREMIKIWNSHYACRELGWLPPSK